MKKILIFSGMIALVISSFMLWVGFQHNPQWEFYDTITGKVEILYSMVLFSSWYIPTFLVLLLSGICMRKIWKYY